MSSFFVLWQQLRMGSKYSLMLKHSHWKRATGVDSIRWKLEMDKMINHRWWAHFAVSIIGSHLLPSFLHQLMCYHFKNEWMRICILRNLGAIISDEKFSENAKTKWIWTFTGMNVLCWFYQFFSLICQLKYCVLLLLLLIVVVCCCCYVCCVLLLYAICAFDK